MAQLALAPLASTTAALVAPVPALASATATVATPALDLYAGYGGTPNPDPNAPISGFSSGISPLYGKINPFYGDVNAQYGKINPFYGKINPFYGKINPFFGDVSGFWGKINPFSQNADANLSSFYGKIDPFWGSANPYLSSNKGLVYSTLSGFWSGQFANWTNLMSAWSNADTSADGAALARTIQTGMINPTVKFWSPIASQYPNKPNVAALIKNQLVAAGVGFNADGSINGDSLLAMTPSQQGLLFLNTYDSMMDYSGTGHADWWMAAVNWNPALGETQGKVPAGGTPPTIGMIDFVVAQGANVSKQVMQYGSSVFNDGHGAAVGSLIVGATDGSGVLGVLPTGAAKVAVYDPYDDTGTTNWTDVGTGVQTLAKLIFVSKTTPVGVLNASLGVPGWTLNPGWNDALANAGAHGHDLVIAAGNDGAMQTQNVPWNFDANPTILIVGSIGADGGISNFSNTPGEACLLPTGSSSTICTESNKIKYRFIVAPGELILVSDGLGGHYRQSGTSLAAPLVSGAIAMLQNRWPWLSLFPDETASIILKSATPLGGIPGADPVYGVGKLNIGASQSPLNWTNLVYFPAKDGKLLLPAGIVQSGDWSTVLNAGVPLSVVAAQLAGTTQSSWNASGLAYSAFERIGATFRDFEIPLASKLVGQNVTTLAGGQLYQSYLTAAFRAQTGHFATLGTNTADIGLFSNGFERSSAPAGMVGGMRMRVNVSAIGPATGFRANSNSLYETGASLIGEHDAVRFGFGDGASALDTGDSFAFRSDHDLGTGGANPVLGLASGGAYLGGRMALTPRLSVSVGTTQRDAWRNPISFGLGTQTGSWVNRYAADAQTVNVSYAVTPNLVTHAGFTHLRERNALLGIQSLSQADLRGGSATEAAAFGFDLRLKHGLTLSGSGTLARSRADGGQIMTNDLTGTAAALALTKTGLLGRHDELRLMAATPLHTIAGHVTYSAIGVVDRQTGAIGVVSQTLASGSGRLPLTGEVMYGRRLPGLGELSLFGRVERSNALTTASPGTDALGTMGGIQVQLAF